MRKTRKALLASLLISATVALGLALSGIPNIELMTFTVFVSGYLLGRSLGVVVGAASIMLHSLFNPLGVAMPILLVSQILGFSVVGLTGAVAGPWVAGMTRRALAFVVCGAAGFLLTLLYDVLTNVGAFLTITSEQARSGLAEFVLAGMIFMALHLAWNTGLFLVTLKPVLNVLTGYQRELAEGD